MSDVTYDGIVQALLDDFDQQYRRLLAMPEGDAGKPGAICRLDELRQAWCLLLASPRLQCGLSLAKPSRTSDSVMRPASQLA